MLPRRLLLAAALLTGAAAFSPSGGLIAPSRSSRCAAVSMGRKGRPRGPSGVGAGQPSAMQQQMRTPTPPSDGTPMFYLYCRTAPGKPWYPVSAMKGDGQSKGLIGAWLNSPLGKGVFKDRLDEGVARSIFESERRLGNLAVEQYSILKPFKARLLRRTSWRRSTRRRG